MSKQTTPNLIRNVHASYAAAQAQLRAVSYREDVIALSLYDLQRDGRMMWVVSYEVVVG